jgi:putative oxidoreductase
MISSLTTTTATWSPLPLRIALGAVFIARGSQIIFGAFGGPGFDAWLNNTPVPLGLTPPKLWLTLAAFGQLVGGIMVLLGLLTRVGAFIIGSVMFVAIYGIHWRHGFFLNDNGVDGIEYALALFCMCVALMIEGGGRGSVDASM